jgi:hypothetical protein
MNLLVAVFAHYVVRHTGRKFSLDGKPSPAFPVVLDRFGRVFLPVADYLRERRRMNNAAIDSLADEAYILRGWLNYLDNQGLPWTAVCDDHLQTYADSVLSHRASENRIQRSINLIYQFYLIAQTRLGLIAGIVEDPWLVRVGQVIQFRQWCRQRVIMDPAIQ